MTSPLAVHLGPQTPDPVVRAVEGAGGRLVAVEEARAVVWVGDAASFTEAFGERGAGLPPTVEWVQLPSAGIESWFSAGIVDEDRVWTSAVGAYGSAVAEHAVALLLAGVRGLGRAARARSWDNGAAAEGQVSLRGATVAVLGAGGIGALTIPVLNALGARVIAVTRSGREVPGAAECLPAAETTTIFERADHVIVAAPATAETAALVGAAELAALGPQGWVVNIARGSLVDTEALVEALRDGRIGGAALDVTDPEPLPDGHPLWADPRVIITPHSANPPSLQTPALAERIGENVRRFAAGEELLGRVDPGAGY
ncbi:D-isomer specific 2-hydroxyacid dehydrogenase family protein [Kineococcus gynurae]|uniref:D-isomer specific 2-hydroxyacid dehydrogenase family protein n=1 Tax=Kineococcus gynurae TaxID=452979 RepID=A0ABV5LUA4_9ACTN